MQDITIFPKKLELLHYSTLIAMCQKIFNIATIAAKFKDLGTLYAYLFDSNNEVKKIANMNDFFERKNSLLIYPEKTDFEVSVKLSYVLIVPSYLDDMIKYSTKPYDEAEKFIYGNKVTFCYLVTVGKDELGKVMCKIMTLAIALLTEGLIDLDGSGFSLSTLYVTPGEFAKELCNITEEEIKEIMS